MFKMGSFEAEIAKSMADNLVTNNEARKKEVIKTAQAVQSTKIERAVDHLSAAAELFDSCGLGSTAEVITMLLEKIAHEKHPEVLEFESIFRDKDKDKEKLEEELGDQVIEMESLLGKKKD